MRSLGFKAQEKYDRALEEINTAMKLVPAKAEDFDLRSQLNRLLEHIDLAIADANEAIRLKTDFAHAYVNRGLAYFDLGQYKRATSDEQIALKYDPQLADAYNALNLCNERTGKYTQAIENSLTATRLNQRNATILANYATMLIRTGDLTGAEQALQNAAKLHTNNCAVLFGIALLQLKRHDIVSASENLGKLRAWIERFDPLGRQRSHEAQLLLEMNRPAEALEALAKVKVSFAGTATGEKLALQSRAHRMLNNTQLADAEFSQAKAMLPESVFIKDLSQGTATAIGKRGVIARSDKSNATANVPEQQLSSKADLNAPEQRHISSADLDAVVANKLAQSNLALTGRSTAINSPDKPSTASTVNGRVRDKWALVIGISQFAHPQYNLHYSAKDALDFYHFLINDAHFPKDHVLLLLNEQATRLNIMNAFGDQFLPAVSEPDDMVVIFVSTHGTPATRDKGGRNYIVAYDTDASELYATGVDMDELYRRLKEGVKTDRALIVMDACYSGAGIPGAKALNSADSFDANEIALGSGHLVLSSSSPKERSWESRVSQNGVFTKHLINALKTDSTKIDIKSAFDRTKKEVCWEVKNSYGESQTPQLGGQWEGKELVLSVPPSECRQIYNPVLLQWIRKCGASAAAAPGTSSKSLPQTKHK